MIKQEDIYDVFQEAMVDVDGRWRKAKLERRSKSFQRAFLEFCTSINALHNRAVDKAKSDWEIVRDAQSELDADLEKIAENIQAGVKRSLFSIAIDAYQRQVLKWKLIAAFSWLLVGVLAVMLVKAL